MVDGTVCEAEKIDNLSEALFSLPGSRLAEAVCRLPQGQLWGTCLPGVPPTAALSRLGDAALAALTPVAMAAALIDWPEAGLPFIVDGLPDAEAFAAALVADAAPRPPPSEDDGDFLDGPPAPASVVLPDGLHGRPIEVVAEAGRRWRIEILHRPGMEWVSAIDACLEHTFTEWLAGRLPDPLDAFLVAPGISLRPLVGVAGVGVRLRFIEAVSDARGDVARFRRSHFRRGAACGLAAVVAKAIVPPGGRIGRDADGWPTTWTSCADRAEGLLAPIPSAVLDAARVIRLGVPPEGVPV